MATTHPTAREAALHIVENEGCYCGEVGCVVVDRAHHQGYARFRYDGRNLKIASAICDPAPGMVTRHLCGNKACVNPNHLVEGTQVENGHDTRTHSGQQSWSKLSDADIAAILRDDRLHREIAADFGVTKQAISRIKKEWTL